jgi:hypothetical protein
MCGRSVDEDKIKEDLLFSKEIGETGKAEKLFNIIDSYMITDLLKWSNCIRVCTDRACCMSEFMEAF